MPIPLLGWAALVGAAAIVSAIASSGDNDDSSDSSSYKESLKQGKADRRKERKKVIKEGVLRQTQKMWKNLGAKQSKNGVDLIFAVDNYKNPKKIISNTALNKEYLVLAYNYSELSDVLQDFRTYMAIDGDVSELNPPRTINNFELHNINNVEIPFTISDYKDFSMYLDIFTQDEIENIELRRIISRMVVSYKVAGSSKKVGIELKRIEDLYGEREGLDSDNTYDLTNDSAINKIHETYK